MKEWGLDVLENIKYLDPTENWTSGILVVILDIGHSELSEI